MQGRTHLLAGLLIGFFFFSFVDTILHSFIVLFLAVVGSLLPDIDTTTSLLGRRVKIIGFLFKHRGFFHSLLFAFLITLIVVELSSPVFGMAFGLGVFSHLLLDAITKEGLSFWPIPLHIKGYIRVGSFIEHVLQLILLFCC
ncbi:metal-dependent hydrolase, partial [Candidatus Woesearchaeota archaeon]|nr:metal-dependent hydrolase [Candidatus Woesearchaeota archaeon]